MRDERVDIAVVGAGAAGLMAAIWAGRASNGVQRVVALDGAKKLGAKILVAGGGRCNVTHHAVDASAYAGSSRNAIKKVLRRFDVPETVAFFRELGVDLKREDTGKLFPVTDSARTVLDALLRAAREAGVEVRHPWRVGSVEATGDGFVLEEGAAGQRGKGAEGGGSRGPRTLIASRVVLASGGMSLPKTGSDGHGYGIARSLGHSVTHPVLPSLVPLKLDEGALPRSLSGIATPCALEVRAPSGKRLERFEGPVLCTHFGVSGPAVLDVSRYLLMARHDEPDTKLILSWMPGESPGSVDDALRSLGSRSVRAWVRKHLPERLADALCAHAGVDTDVTGAALTREARRALVRALTEMDLPVTGSRGFLFAEVTAGGVPLAELNLSTMESRVCPGLHLVGEVCDVDGRIGGFNFQWAWASGFVAGSSCAGARAGAPAR